VGNNLNKASTSRRSKRGSKEEKTRNHDEHRQVATATGLLQEQPASQQVTMACRWLGGRLSTMPCCACFHA